MAAISIGGAFGEGFSLIQRKPLAVLLWGLTQLAFAIATFALLAPLYLALFSAARSGAGAAAFQAINPQLLQMQSLTYLIDVLEAVVYAVVYCAVFRAVLHPERGQFGYLRLGMAEFYVVVLLIGGYFAVSLGLVLVVIVAAIIVGILVAVHQIWAAVIVGVLVALALMVALVYFVLRFSLVGPMIVEDGKFHLGESWRMTNGHVWALFMIGLVVFVIILAAEIVFGIVLVALGVGVLGAMAGGLQNLPVFFQQPMGTLFGRLGPLVILVAVLWLPFIGGLTAIMGAPWARAYRDLKPSDLASTFA